MASKIFINLGVKDVKKSTEFFTKLGYKFDPQFTDESATCLILGQESFVMLLNETLFKTFLTKPMADAKKTTEVLLALSLESRAKVDEQVKKAVAAGGKAAPEAKDHGFMYQHGYEDLDGHVWEVFFMEPKK